MGIGSPTQPHQLRLEGRRKHGGCHVLLGDEQERRGWRKKEKKSERKEEDKAEKLIDCIGKPRPIPHVRHT